jgi:hypothetical protein
MKKIFVVLSIAVLFAACVDKEDVTKIDIAHIAPLVEKTAPVKTDSITVIKADTTIICATTVPVTYEMPRGAKETIEYYPIKSNAKGYENGGYLSMASGESLIWGQFIACFEDTKNGDNDYNDFVCSITKQVYVKDWWGTHETDVYYYVQPLALGAGGYANDLSFGVKYADGTKQILTNNIHRDYFNNDTVYINTTYAEVGSWELWHATNQHRIYDIHNYRKIFNNAVSYSLSRLNPFIINNVTHDTIYVAVGNHDAEAINYNSIISAKGVPYGLAIFSGGGTYFHYPLEKVAITTAYPTFASWMKGDIANFPATNYVTDNNYSSHAVCMVMSSMIQSVNTNPDHWNWVEKH